jgi:hypothetical protein
MALPKVKFTNISLSEEVDLLYIFLFEDEWDWGERIVKKNPKIKEVFSFKNEKERIKFLKDFIVNFRKENQELIEKNKKEYQKEWGRIEKDFFIILSEIIQTDWPKNKKIIKIKISANPICPRSLSDWSFSLFYNYKKAFDATEIIMHEACHFLYFEKWKKLYPEMDNKKFDEPHIEWHLSEILAPIILNDVRIQKLLKHKAIFYKEHKRIKIDGKTAPKYFGNLYKKTAKEKNFEEFLKEAYRAIKKNNKSFKE